MNPTDLFLLVIPAASVFAFSTPTFEIKRLILVSLPPAPPAREICCPALSHAWVLILFVTLQYPLHKLLNLKSEGSNDSQRNISRGSSTAPIPALLAVLFACAAEGHDAIAALPAALRVDAVAPPVPSFGRLRPRGR
jgi:hypothetical protein